MRILGSLFVLITSIASLQICPGQEYVQDQNWIGMIEGGNPSHIVYRYRYYTPEDVVEARKQLVLLNTSQAVDEWAGSYFLAGELSDQKLIWKPDAGFFSYYIYTCALELRTLNYGKVVNTPDYIQLVTEKRTPPHAKVTSAGPVRLVKVKWGDVRYLVDEDELEIFCELAAGYHGAGKMLTEKSADGETYEYQKYIWNSYWTKIGKKGDKVFGTPILPKRYAKFSRPQLETTITSLGKYEIEKAEGDESWQSGQKKQFVTIGLGSVNGVKPDMNFYVPELDERITVVKVFGKTAVAVLERSINSETQKEDCLTPDDGDGPCQPIKIGMKIKTVPEEFLEELREKQWAEKNPDQ